MHAIKHPLAPMSVVAVKSAHVSGVESRSLRLSSRLDSKALVIEVPKTKKIPRDHSPLKYT
jgi:hypothetical protein